MRGVNVKAIKAKPRHLHYKTKTNKSTNRKNNNKKTQKETCQGLHYNVAIGMVPVIEFISISTECNFQI